MLPISVSENEPHDQALVRPCNKMRTQQQSSMLTTSSAPLSMRLSAMGP